MAVNKSALDALNSLATGGSSGLDAYKQAQQNEANSRTQALQGALGGNDVYDAAMKSTAQFAPKVQGTGLENAGSLLPAANQYLSEAANRIASDNYVSHLQDTAKNRDAQLAGASEVYANQQRDALGGKLDATYGSQGINDLVAKRSQLEARRNELGMTGPGAQDQLVRAIAGGNANPEVQQRLADVQALGQEMTANEQALREAYGTYAGAAGTDTKGFDAALAAGNITGGAGSGSVADLATFLNPRAQANREQAQAEGERGIQMGGQARLRELAPLFGYDPLEAEGKFPAGEGNDLARAGALGQQEDYVEGKTTTADQNAAEGGQLGFEDPKAYGSFKNQTRMSGQDISRIMQTGEWNDLKDLTTQYIAQGGRRDETGSTVATGVEGYRQAVQAAVEGAKDKDGNPLNLSDKDTAALINLATAYFNPTIGRAFGKGEAE